MDRITISDELKEEIENTLNDYENPKDGKYDESWSSNYTVCTGMLCILKKIGYDIHHEFVKVGKDEDGYDIEEIRYHLVPSLDNIEKDIDKPGHVYDREFDYYKGIIGNDNRKLYICNQTWLYTSDEERRTHKGEMLAKGWEPVSYSKHGEVFVEDYEYLN